MESSPFKTIVKRKVHTAAVESLILKTNGRTKGFLIKYEDLQMSQYLLAKNNISVKQFEV